MAEVRRRPPAGSVHRPPERPASRAAGEGLRLWDRPALLNLIADLCLLFGSAALTWAAFTWFLRQPMFPLEEVVVRTPPAQVTVAQLEYAARSAVKGNFFTVDLDEVRLAFEKLPWVRRAEVRRQWPDQLELRLEEHVAVAFWSPDGSGDTRLVNRQGEVFVAASNASLPKLSGPEGSAGYVLGRFARLAELVAPLGQELTELALSPRQAWQLRLSDGLVIQLGREQESMPIERRLTEFVGSFPEARAKSGIEVAVADLRYPSGYALRGASVAKPVKGKK